MAMTQRQFGRRARFDECPNEGPRVAIPSAAAIDAPSIDRTSIALSGSGSTSDEDELRDWTRARRHAIPWRQVLLMASLCFGVAAFVLPDTVSDALDWLLYGLMAASFIAGIRRRRKGV